MRQAEELFRAELELIERVIASICRRSSCYAEEAEDFGSTVKLKLIENDYAILAKFQGRAKLSTYLTTVIHNMFRDYRIHKWGRWRPSARARRLGEVAVQLETLTSRDGFETAEAVEILRVNQKVEMSKLELLDLAAQLPLRVKRRFEGEKALENLGGPDGVEQLVIDEERAEAAARTQSALATAMAQLGVEDRLLLKMRFGDGFTVAQIAGDLRMEQRPLYSRFEKCLGGLRAAMKAQDVSWDDARETLEWDFSDLKVDYGAVEGLSGKTPDVSV